MKTIQTTNNLEALYRIAETQQGLFTATQAVKAGISDNNHGYHVAQGNWIREGRGIYRLKHYPHSDDSQYMFWMLWSRNRQGKPQGVFSHGTALDLYELSDLAPKKIHMTVPKNFRRSIPTPNAITIHRSHLEPSEVKKMRGFQVTTPVHTLANVIEEGKISPEFIEQAIGQAFERGLMIGSDLDHLRERLGVQSEWTEFLIRKKVS